MKKVQIPDQGLYLALSEEDNEFAQKVSREFGVPFNELSEYINWLRKELRIDYRRILDDYSEIIDDSDILKGEQYLLYKKKLFASDVVIKSFTIETNKGSLTIDQANPYFDFFLTQIQKFKKNSVTDHRLKEQSLYLYIKGNLLFNIWSYISGYPSLNNFQINILIGMFLVHFKLYRAKTVMTEDEFIANPTEAQDYKHYLNDIVKSRFRKFFG